MRHDDELLTAAKNAAATIGAIYKWLEMVEDAGGATSLSGVAKCHAMLTSLRKNADRTEKACDGAAARSHRQSREGTRVMRHEPVSEEPRLIDGRPEGQLEWQVHNDIRDLIRLYGFEKAREQIAFILMHEADRRPN